MLPAVRAQSRPPGAPALLPGPAGPQGAPQALPSKHAPAAQAPLQPAAVHRADLLPRGADATQGVRRRRVPAARRRQVHVDLLPRDAEPRATRVSHAAGRARELRRDLRQTVLFNNVLPLLSVPWSSDVRRSLVIARTLLWGTPPYYYTSLYLYICVYGCHGSCSLGAKLLLFLVELAFPAFRRGLR